MAETTTSRRHDGALQGARSTRTTAMFTRLETLLRPWGRRRLLLYGLIAGLLCTAIMVVVAPDPWPTQGARFVALREAAIARMQGEPLLTAVVTRRDAETPVGDLTAANPSDDQGVFLFGAILGDLLGSSDPSEILMGLWAILFGTAAAVLPLAFWRITGSLTVAVAAPFAVTGAVLALQIYDLYWIVAWSVLGLLPLVLAVDVNRRKSMFWVLVTACVLAGLATSIRNHAGLPVVAAAGIMLLGSRWRLPGRVAVAIALCIAYLAIPVGVLGVARDARDDQLGASSSTVEVSNTHLFWHPMYLGLGYLPNRYGITWKDEFGIERALQEDPAAIYPTERYEDVMRDLYFEVVEDDPGLVAEVTAKKLVVALAFAAPGLMLLAVGLPALLMLHSRRQDLLRWVVVLLPAVAIGLVQPLVGIPAHIYAAGWIAAVGLLVLLAAGLLAAAAEKALREGTTPATLVRSSVSAILRARRRRTIQLLSVAGVLAVAALWFTAVQFRTQAEDWAARSAAVEGQAP